MGKFVRALVASITSDWRAGPPVTVVRTPDELPVPAPDDARGLLLGGRAWIVTTNISPVDVARTLAHEALGHHGLRQLLGGAWASLMGAVGDGAPGDPVLAELQEGIRAAYGHMSRTAEADEIGAHLVETLAHPMTGRLQADGRRGKVAQALAGLLAREGLLLDRPARSGELIGLLLLAEHLVRHGRHPLAPWRRVRYSPPMPNKPTGPRNPPRSMEEVQRLLRGAERQADVKSSLQFWLYAGGAVLGLGLLVWAVFDILALLFR